MTKRAAGALPVLIPLRHQGGAPLNRQLLEGLREAILTGRLAAGNRVPSTRSLSQELAVSRNTVVDAFEQLAAEGYLESRVGSGTRVCRTLPDGLLRVAAPSTQPLPVTPTRRRAPSQRGRALAALPLAASRVSGEVRAFRVGSPALEAFPSALWGRLLRRRWAASSSLLDYGEAAGDPRLRAAVAAYLRASRGVRCEAEQVLVVGGCQQALDLAARVLLDQGDAAWLEDPGYQGARGALLAAGARVVAVPVDGEGLDVAAGRRQAPQARLVHVAPSHQFPLGVTMTLSRRLELLRWARGARAWILEDDYDSEFRYGSRPLPSLQGLDADGRVVYVGTFSKVLFPSLRLAYLVVPPGLQEAFRSARHFASTHSPRLDQAVVADFMEEGHFERHIRRMRALYLERQQGLLAAARRHLTGLVELAPAEAGMHLVGWLPEGRSDRLAAEAAARQGVDAIPLSFFGTRPQRPALLLGYAAVSPLESRGAAERLAQALASPAAHRSREP